MASGNAGVIGTLWPVRDLAASVLMIRFYGYWLDERNTPAHALAKAQVWLARSRNEEMAAYVNASNIQRYEEVLPKDEFTRLAAHCDQLQSALKRRRRSNDSIGAIVDWAAFYLSGL